MKLGPGFLLKVVQQLTGPEKLLKNVDRSAVGHAAGVVLCRCAG